MNFVLNWLKPLAEKASGHILVVSIWIKSSIMTSFSEIGQLSLDFWTKNQFF